MNFKSTKNGRIDKRRDLFLIPNHNRQLSPLEQLIKNWQGEETNTSVSEKENEAKTYEVVSAITINNDNSTIEFLRLDTIKKLLNYKDLRSVARWCEENNVFILKNGNRSLVNKLDFLLAYNKPFLSHLKKDHEDWEDRFIAYWNNNVKGLIKDDSCETVNQSSYKPKSNVEQSFLDNLSSI